MQQNRVVADVSDTQKAGTGRTTAVTESSGAPQSPVFPRHPLTPQTLDHRIFMQDLGMGPTSGTLGLPDPCEQTE